MRIDKVWIERMEEEAVRPEQGKWEDRDKRIYGAAK